MNYYVVYTGSCNEVIVEIFNECDILKVQEIMVKEGYIIIEVICEKYMKCRKFVND